MPARPNGAVAAAFAEASTHHQAGRLAEAEALYRRVLAADPRHADSLHRLGLVAYQVGRADVAVDLIERAVAQNPREAAYHSHLSLALGELGRLDEAARSGHTAVRLDPQRADFQKNLGVVLVGLGEMAEAADAYRRTLVLDPGLADAHNNLGDVLLELGAPAEAEQSYRRALALAPDFAEAHTGLGAALLDLDRPEDAIAAHRRALALQPDLANAHNNLGAALSGQGRPNEAEPHLRRAIALMPDFYQAHSNLGGVLKAAGRLDEAIASLERAQQLAPARPDILVNLAQAHLAKGDPSAAMTAAVRALAAGGSTPAKLAFVQCARRLKLDAGGEAIRPWLLRALREGWGRPEDLAALTAGVLRAGPVDALADDPLLRALLPLTPNVDFDLEGRLTAARRALLDAAVETPDAYDPAALDFHLALAQQGFVNEYVWRQDDDEAARVAGLRDGVSLALRTGAWPPACQVVALAAYVPLASVPLCERLLDGVWPSAVATLLTQQIREPAEEARLASQIPRLASATDEVSRQVQAQYEENPYPRWVDAGLAEPAKGVLTYLGGRFPFAGVDGAERAGVEILVAGCGTGRNAIDATRRFSGARTLAIDLSLSSLAHAVRKSRELGLDQIEYAQADLLRLDSLQRRFDLVEAVGVLHHLRDPFEGWRTLLSLLRPGGFMKVGLYSQLARRNLPDPPVQPDQGRPAADVVRQARQALAARNDAQARQALAASDFYSVSSCRDLLFHVQEHRLTLGQIEAFLRDQDLKLIGFEVDDAVLGAYRRRWPDDLGATDLGRWAGFEAEHPDTFAGMYEFWVQKP